MALRGPLNFAFLLLHWQRAAFNEDCEICCPLSLAWGLLNEVQLFLHLHDLVHLSFNCGKVRLHIQAALIPEGQVWV